MSNIQIRRDHTGSLHLYVGGVPALGARVVSISAGEGGKLFALATVPLDVATFAEMDSVVAMPGFPRTTRAA